MISWDHSYFGKYMILKPIIKTVKAVATTNFSYSLPTACPLHFLLWFAITLGDMHVVHCACGKTSDSINLNTVTDRVAQKSCKILPC